MMWCLTTLGFACSRCTVFIKPAIPCKSVVRLVASTFIGKNTHLSLLNYGSCLPSSSHCNRYYGDGVRWYTADSSQSTRLDTRKYLLSLGVNVSRLGVHSRSILQRGHKEVNGLVEHLKLHGFSLAQVVTLIEKDSSVLMLDEQDLQNRLDVFSDLGLEPQGVVKTSKLVFFSDLDVITANVQVMQDLLKASPQWICSLFKYKPQVFQNTCDFTHEEIRNNIIMIREVLLHFGCTDVEKVLRQIMRDDYRLFRISQAQVKLIVEFLIENGITGKDLVYVIKRSANIFQSTPAQLTQRMRNLQNMLKLDKTQFQQFVIRYPRALGMNSSNLDKHIKFFEKRGIHVHFIANNPYVLWVSIKTLEKRYKELKELGVLSTEKEISLALVKMVSSNKEYARQIDLIKSKQDVKKKESIKLG